MQTAESSLPEHHGVDLAVVMLRQIKARHGHEAVCEVACDMLITAAAILRQESGTTHARRVLEFAAEALAVDTRDAASGDSRPAAGTCHLRQVHAAPMT